MVAMVAGMILAMTPLNPGQFVGVAGEPVDLLFQFEEAAEEATFLYEVLDYRGEAVLEGAAERREGNQLAVTLTPEAGYYDLHFPEAESRFGLVALPPRPEARDPFFGVDAALTWLELDDAMRGHLITQMEALGVDMVRERMAWTNVEAEQGQFNWEPARGKDSLRQNLDAAGLHMLEMFHDAPPWTGRTNANPYPQDLIATYRSWREITGHWSGVWDAFEIWNEPDIYFGGYLPADQYSAVAKVLSQALRDGGFTGDIGVGVFTHLVSRHQLDAFAASGMLEAGHFVGFHTYEPVRAVAHQATKYREWLAAWDEPDTPLWLTESGWPWERGPARPPREQDAESAHISIGKMVEARATGIARHFAFVYPFYEENDHNFGMMDKHGTPLRAAAAFGQIVRALSNTTYLGDWATSWPEIDTARVFGRDDTAVLVLIAKSTPATPDIALEITPRQVQGIDGRTLTLNADGSVPVRDGMVFVYLDREEAAAHLNADASAMELYAIHQAAERKTLPDFPVVLQVLPDLTTWNATSRGYQVPDTGEALPLKLRVNNLTEATQQVALELADNERAHTAALGSHEVAAMRYVEITHALDFSEFGDGPRKSMRLTARDDAGELLDQLQLDFILQQEFETALAGFSFREALPITEMERWQWNAPAGTEMQYEHVGEDVWRCSIQFGESDRWAYPILRLPEDSEVAKAEAVLLEARVEAPADVRIMLTMRDGTTFYTSDPIINDDGEWHSALVWIDELGLMSIGVPEDSDLVFRIEEVDRVQIGLNSKVDTNVLEVRNAWLVGAE